MADVFDLPELPAPVAAEELQAVDEAGLEALVGSIRDAERATLAAMSPFDAHLREIRARLAEVSTERRRRERAATTAQRRAVRDQAKAGDLPSLADVLAGGADLPDDLDLARLPAFLRTGGSVTLGFPGRPGPTAFTDGRRTQTAKTWGDARRLYLDGWEPGTPQVPGVRVHLSGTKVERVTPAEDIVVDTKAARSGA